MIDKKTIKQWEIERGLIFNSDVDLSQELTEEEFSAMVSDPKFNVVGVMHADRVKFLTSNGYPVTRENMIDSSLSHKEK